MEPVHLSEREKQRAQDLRWAMRSSEVRQHAGKLVAVHRERVVGFGVAREKLIAEAADAAQCLAQDIVVVVVPGKDLAEVPK